MKATTQPAAKDGVIAPAEDAGPGAGAKSWAATKDERMATENTITTTREAPEREEAIGEREIGILVGFSQENFFSECLSRELQSEEWKWC